MDKNDKCCLCGRKEHPGKSCMEVKLKDSKPSPEFKVIGDEEKIKFAERILQLTHGKDIKWGHHGTEDDDGWRREEKACMKIVNDIIDITTACNKVIQYYQSQELETAIETAVINYLKKREAIKANKDRYVERELGDLKNDFVAELLLLINSQRMGEQQKVAGEIEK